MSRADSAVHTSTGIVAELRNQVEALTAQHEEAAAEAQRRESDIHDLISAIRALTCDAEMRCALDERGVTARGVWRTLSCESPHFPHG